MSQKISDEELAEKAYETWDAYGGRALGRWGAPHVLDAWLAVIEAVRESLPPGASHDAT